MLRVLAVNAFVVLLSVLIHYEFLYRSTKILPLVKIRHRMRVLAVVIIAFIAHVIEIWLYGLAFYFMHNSPNWGTLQGNYDGSLLDSVYFSFTSFSTLGFGDISPIGDIRFLVGLEGLAGFVLITWSASFLFFEMQKNWSAKD